MRKALALFFLFSFSWSADAVLYEATAKLIEELQKLKERVARLEEHRTAKVREGVLKRDSLLIPLGSGRKKVIKAGTTVKVFACKKGLCLVKTPAGTQGWISKEDIEIKGERNLYEEGRRLLKNLLKGSVPSGYSVSEAGNAFSSGALSFYPLLSVSGERLSAVVYEVKNPNPFSVRLSPDDFLFEDVIYVFLEETSPSSPTLLLKPEEKAKLVLIIKRS